MIHRAPLLFSAPLMIATPAFAQEAADRIFHGGPVLTMQDDRPRAEAVAVRDGDILAVGTEAEVMRHRGPETDMVDLAGRAHPRASWTPTAMSSWSGSSRCPPTCCPRPTGR